MKVAVLDDWQAAARASADWSGLEARASLVFFQNPFPTPAATAEALGPFDVLVATRERTAFGASLLQRLPRLKMIAMTGRLPGSLDLAACTAQGVLVVATAGQSTASTAEHTLGLILSAMRHIPAGDAAVRAGHFQAGVGVGTVLEGRTLGIIGLGRIGSRVARYGQALGMRILAWSPNLTEEVAAAAGARRVGKDALLADADVVSLHVTLSDRSRGLVGAADLARMKPGAVIVNTSRGPLIDEAALVEALCAGRIRAALDVFDREPLPQDHPLRSASGTVLTPHLGYCTDDVFRQYYSESVANVLSFLDGVVPPLCANPEVFPPGP